MDGIESVNFVKKGELRGRKTNLICIWIWLITVKWWMKLVSSYACTGEGEGEWSDESVFRVDLIM